MTDVFRSESNPAVNFGNFLNPTSFTGVSGVPVQDDQLSPVPVGLRV